MQDFDNIAEISTKALCQSGVSKKITKFLKFGTRRLNLGTAIGYGLQTVACASALSADRRKQEELTVCINHTTFECSNAFKSWLYEEERIGEQIENDKRSTEQNYSRCRTIISSVHVDGPNLENALEAVVKQNNSSIAPLTKETVKIEAKIAGIKKNITEKAMEKKRKEEEEIRKKRKKEYIAPSKRSPGKDGADKNGDDGGKGHVLI